MNIPDPKSIAQNLLDVTAAALTSENFDQFERCFALPHTIETPEGIRVVETRDDFRALFDKVCRHYKEANVTDIIRHCDQATLRPDGTIAASHQTRLVNKTELVQRPYPCFAVISFVDGAWKVSASTYAIIDNPGQLKALSA